MTYAMEHDAETRSSNGTIGDSVVAALQENKNTNEFDFGEAAKVLSFKGVGRNTLFKICRDAGYLMDDNEPYQRTVNEGLFTVRLVPTGNAKHPLYYAQTHITLKGLAKIEPLVRKVKERYWDRRFLNVVNLADKL